MREVDSKTVKSDLDELESLLMRCQNAKTDIARKVTRFKEAQDELSELLTCLNLSSDSSSNQVCLVTNLPHWARDAIEYFTKITSNLPHILQAIDSFDLDAIKAKLATLTNEPPRCISVP